MTRGAAAIIDDGMRPSKRSRGSTRWSSTEMIVYERSRGSGSGSNGSAVVRSSFCSAQPWVGSRTSGIAHSPVTSAFDFRMPLDLELVDSSVQYGPNRSGPHHESDESVVPHERRSPRDLRAAARVRLRRDAGTSSQHRATRLRLVLALRPPLRPAPP